MNVIRTIPGKSKLKSGDCSFPVHTSSHFIHRISHHFIAQISSVNRPSSPGFHSSALRFLLAQIHFPVFRKNLLQPGFGILNWMFLILSLDLDLEAEIGDGHSIDELPSVVVLLVYFELHFVDFFNMVHRQSAPIRVWAGNGAVVVRGNRQISFLFGVVIE